MTKEEMLKDIEDCESEIRYFQHKIAENPRLSQWYKIEITKRKRLIKKINKKITSIE